MSPPHIRLVLLGAAAIAVTVVLTVTNPIDLLGSDIEAEPEAARGQSRIEIAELTTIVEADGALMASGTRVGLASGPGTVTAIAPVGTEVGAATELFDVDGQVSVAMLGSLPAWRTMSVDDVGADVEQLEQGLVELGYDPDGLLSVDDTFTSYTATVVERWQEDLGREQTGVVELGSVVFVPEPATVTSTSGSVGQELGAQATPLLQVSAGTNQLVFAVEAQDLTSLETGTTVTARLPDRSELNARVHRVVPSGGGTWTATATVTDDDRDTALPEGDAIPVTVSWIETVAPATTTVRATALTRLDSGAVVVEVVDEEGEETRFVEVTVGVSVGSTVEIITDLPAGTTVIDP